MKFSCVRNRNSYRGSVCLRFLALAQTLSSSSSGFHLCFTLHASLHCLHQSWFGAQPTCSVPTIDLGVPAAFRETNERRVSNMLLKSAKQAHLKLVHVFALLDQPGHMLRAFVLLPEGPIL